ncbi:MAG: ABC transporter ATP-binding protein [Candidatus Omnitrophica bacterium]|nr:ABC transporter ATP-binding protein [Candidatus Omnitrophota bacterium]
MIKIEGLKKNYGTKEAVKGLDLEIPEGELFVLVGPNGAGKTTTIKMLVGLLRPSAGRVVIGGLDIQKNSTDAKQLISFVPDTPYVYEKLTPWELLRFVGKLYKMTPGEIEKRGAELLRFFSIADVQDVLIEEFSHGMRQKVVLSASLLHNPKLFVLDEPMVGLDPVSIKNFKDFLRHEARQKMTVIFSSHMLSMAEELADRIAIMDHGRIIALGSVAELRQKYQSQENLEQMFMNLIEKEEMRKPQ